MAAVCVWETLRASVSGGAGISHFLRGQMGCACEETSAKGGYGVVSRL